MSRLHDVPPDLSAFMALLRYARKWWDADSDHDGEGFNAGDSAWEAADLVQAIEQAEQVFPAGIGSHTLPLVLRFATIMERVLGDQHPRDFFNPDPSTVDDIADSIMPSWRIGDPREIYGVLINACTTLAGAINDKANDSAVVGRKAAIVACYALMLADINGAVGDWPEWQIEKVRASGRGAPPTVD